MDLLKQLLRPPPYVLDNEDRRLARLLHTLLLGVLIANIAVFPLTIFAKPTLLVVAVHLLVFALVVVLLIVLHASNVRLAALLIVVLMNLAGMGANLLLGRPFSVISVLGILSLVVIGLQASGRNLIITLLISIGLAAVTGFVSLIYNPTAGRAWITLFDAVVYIWASVFGGFLVYLSISELRQALDVARDTRQQLTEQNASLMETMQRTESLRQHQENFTHKLREVVNSANSLMQCQSLDELWHTALKLAKERIGLVRCSIFLVDETQQVLHGTYGSNRFGEIIDEHGHVLPITEAAILKGIDYIPQHTEANWEVNPDVEFREWKGDHSVVLNRGWMVSTLIRPKDGLPMAVFFNDAGLTNEPMQPDKQDLLAVFCSILANVAERKKAEMRQNEFATGLREVLSSADELLRTRSLDEFWARAARLAQRRLGVERIRFYQLHDAATGLFRGTYGVDLSQQVVDYGMDNWRSPELYADLKERRATTERLTWQQKDDQELLDLLNGQFHVVARGWVVNTPIFSDAGKLIGVMFNDNAISGAPVVPQRQDLLVAYASLLGSMAERRLADERQRQMTSGLRAVLGCANELLAVKDLDIFWRTAVELAINRLGVERCSIFLNEPGTQRFHGTYGTDIFHKVVAEHDIEFVSGDFSDFVWSTRSQRSGRVWAMVENAAHITKTESGYRTLQQGWVVDTPIVETDGKALAVFFNDTAISRAPLNEDLQDIVAVYCTLLGHIFERKRMEMSLYDSNAELERRVEERTRQLQRSESYFRTLIQQSADVITVISLDGTIHFESPSSMRAFAHSGRVGQNIFELMHPDDVDQVARAMVGLVDPKELPSVSFAVRVKRGDGTWADTESQVSLLYDDDQQLRGIVVNARDISERKRLADANRESEARFRNIANVAPNLICTIDADLKIDFVNLEVRRFLGMTLDEPTHEQVFAWFHPDDQSLVADMFSRVYQQVPAMTIEARLKNAQGEYRWLSITLAKRYDESGRMLGYIAAATDINTHKETQRALERQLHFEQLLASWSDQLIEHPFGQLGSTIENVLAEFGQFIDVQIVRVFLCTPSKFWLTHYEWITPEHRDRLGISLKGSEFVLEDHLWGYVQSKQQEVLALSDINELPETAHLLLEHFLKFGVTSALNLPLHVESDLFGQLALDVIGPPRQWSNEDIRMANLVANLIGQALRQWRAAEVLQHREAVEHLIATTSAEFARLPVMQIGDGIQFVLQSLGQTFKGDASRLLLFEQNPSQIADIYEWRAQAEGSPVLPSLREVLAARELELDESLQQLQQVVSVGHIQWIQEIEAFQPVQFIRHLIDTLNSRSGLMVPIMLGNRQVGVLSLESTQPEMSWASEDIGIVKLIAEAISNGLARKQTHQILDQRLAFEQRVAEISTHFLSLPPDQIDAGIDFALKTLGEFTRVAYVRLFQYFGDDTISTNTHEWHAEGITSQRHALQNMRLNENSWWQQELRRRKLIYFPSLQDMPPEASAFAKNLTRRGIHSLLSIALIHGDTFIGELGLDSLVDDHIWTEADMRLLRLVGEVISNALVRQRDHLRIQGKVAAETMIANISYDFVRQPVYKIDAAIDNALAQLGQFVRADFCSLYEIAEDQSSWSNTHEWHADFIAPQIDLMQQRPYERIFWWWEHLIRHGNIVLDEVSTAPDMPDNVRQDLMSRGIRSTIAIPILQNGLLIGELGLDLVMDVRKWSPDTIRWAELVADLIGNAIERKRNANALQLERDLLEARVTDRTHELTKLLDVTKTVNATLELQPLLNLIIDQLKGVVAYDALTISEFNEEHSKVIIFEGPPLARHLATDWSYDVEQDVHITEMIVNRRAVIVADIFDDHPNAIAARRRFQYLGVKIADQMQSVLYVPLIVRDRVIGMMTLYSNIRKFYTEHHARLAMAFANQSAVAIENARLHEQAVQAAALGERSRLARELHDSVSQALFGIVLGARTVMQNGRKTNDLRVLEPMDYVLKLAEAALAEMRALIFELRPESLQNEGLLVAFQKQSEAICARHRIDVKADLGDIEPPVPIAIKEALYRIGLEAIQNTIKHANATAVELKLRVLGDHILLEIQDNGRGFDVQGKFPGHFGLYTMRERAEQFGGRLDLISSPYQGTTVRVRMPLQQERMTSNGQQTFAY